MSKLEMSPEILGALHTLSSVLQSEDALEKTLQTVVDLSVATLPGCDSAGILLLVDGGQTTAAASDEYTLAIDKIQYESGEGPCVAALEEGELKLVTDIAEEPRWPEFVSRAAEKGYRSGASLPLKWDGRRGSLNLYSKTERAFDEGSLAVARVFAHQAGIALENAQTYLAAHRLADQLNEALQSRDLIGQAKGMLMEREGVSDEEAFEMLKTISQNANVKLRDIAQRLIEENPNAAK